MNNFNLYLACLLLVFTMSCRKESISTETEISVPEPTIFIESSIYGFVTDKNGAPIEAADVFWGNSTTSTDQNGYFKLKGTVTNRNAKLRVQKENYFEAHQTHSILSPELIQTEVQLIERIVSGSIAASTGGSIEVDGGGTVEFAANSFVDESGNPYTGTVNVYTTYLDPTRPDLRAVMPGNLMAINSANESQLLKSFGMINVELESSAGNPLQIAQPATLTTPVPDDLSGLAPASIPLWHFDTELGLWIEEGQAELQGNTYVGEVSHFTWWNCDIPENFVTLSGFISPVSAIPMIDIQVTQVSNGSKGILTISQKGGFIGQVPKDETLLLNVLSTCGEQLYTEVIGPFSVDTNLPAITIDINELDIITINGSAQNCDQLPVTNGYVIVHNTQNNTSITLSLDNNGNFSSQYITCGTDELSITTIDLNERTQSDPIVFSAQADIDVGIINTCDQIIEYKITFLMDGEEKVFTPCTADKGPNAPGIPNIDGFRVLFQIPGQNSGSINYTFTFIDWNTSPPDPTYVASYTTVLMGGALATDGYDFEFDDATFTRLSQDEQPGDLFNFIIENVTVLRMVNGFPTINEGSTIEIEALMQ